MNETGIMNESVTKERKQTDYRTQVLYSFLSSVLEMRRKMPRGFQVKAFWLYP